MRIVEPRDETVYPADRFALWLMQGMAVLFGSILILAAVGLALSPVAALMFATPGLPVWEKLAAIGLIYGCLLLTFGISWGKR